MATIQIDLSLSDLVEKLIIENDNSRSFVICDLFKRLSSNPTDQANLFNLIVRYYECVFDNILQEKELCSLYILKQREGVDVSKIYTKKSDNKKLTNEDFDDYILDMIHLSCADPQIMLTHDSNTLSNIKTILSHNYGVNADDDEISASLVRVCFNLLENAKSDERFIDEIPEEQ